VYLEGKEEDMKRTLGVVLLAVVVGIGTGCGDQAKEQAAEAALAEIAQVEARAETEARNVELVKTVIASLEKGQADVFTRLFAPDFKLYFPSNSLTPIPREDAMGMAKMMITAVPDLAYNILDIFPSGDRVFMRIVFEGTHRAVTGGKPPLEIEIASGAMAIFRVKDGLIVEEIIDGDALGLLRQLGLELRPGKPAK
jgi:ketosteroid isomerase-like protein